MRGARSSRFGVVPAFIRLLQSISGAQKRERVRFGGVRSALHLANALLDGSTGDRTIRADVIGIVLTHLPEYRPAYFHRCVEEFALHSPGTVVSRTALDCRDH